MWSDAKYVGIFQTLKGTSRGEQLSAYTTYVHKLIVYYLLVSEQKSRDSFNNIGLLQIKFKQL